MSENDLRIVLDMICKKYVHKISLQGPEIYESTLCIRHLASCHLSFDLVKIVMMMMMMISMYCCYYCCYYYYYYYYPDHCNYSYCFSYLDDYNNNYYYYN